LKKSEVSRYAAGITRAAYLPQSRIPGFTN
jgi:hypothetical protein